MNNPYCIHFSGMVGIDVWGNSISLKGNLLSTELCVAKGILYSIRSFNDTFYKEYGISSGFRHYDSLYTYVNFWENHEFIKKEDYLFGRIFMPLYRRFLLKNIQSYL